MRAAAIPALLLLALAGLAVVPTASAAPPAPVCNGTVGGTVSPVDPVTVFVSPPCYDVYVEAMSCPLGNGEWTHYQVQTVGVHVYTCSEDPATASSSAPPCTCPPPPQCTSVTTVGPLAQIVSVTVTHDCRVIVAVLPYLVACNEPLDGSKAVSVGRITVSLPCGDIGPCEAPFECYPASTSAVFIPPVCIWKEVATGPVKAGVDQCRESHETFPCSSPQRIHHYEQVGPAYAQVHFCFPHSPPPDLAVSSPAMADPFPTCIRECSPVPTDACDLRDATPTTVGPFALPFNPQAFVWGNDCDIDVEPIGACAPPSGKTIEQRIGPIDARLLVCDGGLGDIADGWS